MIKKTMFLIVWAVLCLDFFGVAQGIRSFSGRVLDDNGTAVAGANLRLGKLVSVSDASGGFKISGFLGDTLVVSAMGFGQQRVVLRSDVVLVSLIESAEVLAEHKVLSNGYQVLPRERSTGSFVLVDSALLSSRVTGNLLDRLDGVVSGLVFNRGLDNQANNASIAIRGRSTLFASAEPLIILDNFPFEGELSNINPGDVESVTVLKDAAAASIWGVRAGNGVIVITTKKGRRSAEQVISMTANMILSPKFDVFAAPWMGSADYVDLEAKLFDLGYYDGAIGGGFVPVSPAVELLLAKREGRVSAADAALGLSALAGTDGREQWSDLFYRSGLRQQYQLSISGGSDKQKYLISGGWDQDQLSLKTESLRRLTLSANNTYYLLGDRLELFSGFSLTSGLNRGSTDSYVPFTPYDHLLGAAGEALEVGSYLRPSYTDLAGGGKLLDWKYRPLEEMNGGRRSQLRDYRLNLSLSYRILQGLKVSGTYQYQRGLSELSRLNTYSSFYTRNMINSFSVLDAGSGVMSSPIAAGDIVMGTATGYSAQNGRLQLDFNRRIGIAELSFTGGGELKVYDSSADSRTLYGYDQASASNSNALIDETQLYPNFYSGGLSRIVTSPSRSLTADRYRSVYAIGAATFFEKYTLSGSFRRDESNLFGVRGNQKGVPLWSVGAKYDLAKEGFYGLSWLPLLSLRATFGYNGNVDKRTSAYLTAMQSFRNSFGALTSEIVNPPNPSLRWERVRNLNLGLDFGLRGNVLSGSLAYFSKYGKDLIANSTIVPQTGITVFRGNSANTLSRGLEATLNASLTGSDFSWNSQLLFNYSREKVTRYVLAESNNMTLVAANYLNPVVGYPYNAVFSLPYAGLDSTGEPIGFLDGQQSQDYGSIASSYNRSDLRFHGSAVPVVFGGLNNTLGYKGWSLTFNMTYKLNYYYRLPGVFASNDFSFRQFGYSQRWQQSGDESRTDIPAFLYPGDANRAALFTNSEQLVQRGDHIRLQYVQLSYPLQRLLKRSGISGSVYLGMSELGIIWRKSKTLYGLNYDPDYGYAKAPMTTSFGLKLNLN